MPQKGLERTYSPSPSVTQLGLPPTVTWWQYSWPEVTVRLVSTVGGVEGTLEGAEVGATVAVGDAVGRSPPPHTQQLRVLERVASSALQFWPGTM